MISLTLTLRGSQPGVGRSPGLRCEVHRPRCEVPLPRCEEPRLALRGPPAALRGPPARVARSPGRVARSPGRVATSPGRVARSPRPRCDREVHPGQKDQMRRTRNVGSNLNVAPSMQHSMERHLENVTTTRSTTKADSGGPAIDNGLITNVRSWRFSPGTHKLANELDNRSFWQHRNDNASSCAAVFHGRLLGDV